MKTKETQKAITRHHSSPLPSCFQPHAPPSTTTTTTTNPNLTTCLYQTQLGLFSLSWSRSFLSRALHLTLHPTPPLHSLSPSPVSTTSPVFHLSLKPFIFWNKQGIKQLTFPSLSSDSPNPTSIWVFWDFTSAKFGPGPEPERSYYIAVLHQGEMTLLVGDQEQQAYAKTKALKPKKIKSLPSSVLSPLVLRREHVLGKNKLYTTRMELGERMRYISIELNEKCDDGPRLLIKFDEKRVIMVKHLKWKFRGSERIEFDGHPIQLSWDVYNWLFDGEDGTKSDDGYALFTFRFEGEGTDNEDEGWRMRERGVQQQQQQQWSQESCGLNYERKKMKKRLMVKSRRSPNNNNSSLSSSSLSSVSSSCSSVLEWESVEENELKGPTGFSLLVYAWKK